MPRKNRGPWPECLVEAAAESYNRGGSCRGAFYGFEAWQTDADGRLERPVTTEGRGLSAWSKLRRSVLQV